MTPKQQYNARFIASAHLHGDAPMQGPHLWCRWGARLRPCSVREMGRRFCLGWTLTWARVEVPGFHDVQDAAKLQGVERSQPKGLDYLWGLLHAMTTHPPQPPPPEAK